MSNGFEVLQQVQRFMPKTEWFAEPKIVDSIHGLRHLLRVTLLACLIGKTRLVSEDKILNLLVAASLHDVARLNDNADIGHGERSAQWFLENLQTVASHYQLEIKDLDTKLISQLMQFHEIEYTRLEGESVLDQELLDIIKTADGLDRFRQPKLKWWPNFEYLRLRPSEEIIQTAYHLVLNSEAEFLRIQQSQESVVGAFSKLCA